VSTLDACQRDGLDFYEIAQQLNDNIEGLALHLLGEPNLLLSTRQQLRFGNRGSIAVEIAGPKRGTWFDHENSKGGDGIELICVMKGVDRREAFEFGCDWLGVDTGRTSPNNRPAHGASPYGDSKRNRGGRDFQILARYSYCDEVGNLLFEVVRLYPKDFRQRRPNGNADWIWSTKDTRKVPYRLPELLAAPNDQWVFIVEGEKDADNLIKRGLIATTNPGGAAKVIPGRTVKSKWRPEYNKFFNGRRVCILPDNDECGRAHAQDVARNLSPLAADLRIVNLTGLLEKGDVSDWLAAGGTREALLRIVENTPAFGAGRPGSRSPNGKDHQTQSDDTENDDEGLDAGANIEAAVALLPQWVIDRLNDPRAAERSTLFSVIKKLIELDHDNATIERLIRAYPSAIGAKYAGRSDLADEIARVRSKTAAGPKLRGKATKFDDELTAADLAAERARTQKTVEPLIADFNRRYSVVNEAGKVWVFEWREDPVMHREVLDRISHADFRRLYENRRIDVVLGKAIVSKSVADLWLAHPARRQYLAGVTFDPTRKAPPEYMNLWRGFAVEPKPGDWGLMRDHIQRVICSGVPEYADYVLSWIARAFQLPSQPGEVALVLRGKKGIGKGIFGSWFFKAFGQHGIPLISPTQLVGRFNEHLRDCVALFADEAFFAGDKQHEGVLQGLITEPLLTIEGKYQRVVIVPNMLHIILASNSEWVIPASSVERRYCVFDVADNRRGDFSYFAAIERQMKEGGLAAMLHELLARNISDFEVRAVPQTEALVIQKTLSLSSLERWWLAVLSRGFLWKSRFGADYFRNWQTFYSTELLHRSYLQWCQENRPYDRK
jgi:hypothetical protein